ncbi:MAG: PhoH family protein [Sutterella sp.]|nr:PhoH family protein [Sutterella sp.]
MPAKKGDILTDYGPEPGAEKPKRRRAAAAAAAGTPAPETPAAPPAPAEPPAAAQAAEAGKTKKPAVKRAAVRRTPAKPRRKTAVSDEKPAQIPETPVPCETPSADAAGIGESASVPVSASAEFTLTTAPTPRGSQAGRRGRAATPENLPKLFVLDTNVLMHDPLCIFRFAEHDVFLPMTVLEELDNHKKGTSDVARNARTVSRSLDALMEINGPDLAKGVPLALLGNREAAGRLFFETKSLAAPLPDGLPAAKGDNRILAVVKGAQKAYPDHAVVLVSKDINMRIKATTLGIPAEDYLSDKVLDDTDLLYSGKLALPADFWNACGKKLESWQDEGTTFYRFDSPNAGSFVVNQCLTIEGDPDFMAIVTSVQGPSVTMRLLKDYRTRLKVWGIHARNAEQNMALNLLMDPEIDFVTLLGQAGTGKTLMTLAAALTQTIDERRFSEIIVTRATVSVGEDIGFLPGTEEEKMAPWMGALEDNLEVLHRSEGSAGGGEWGRQATLDLIKTRIRIKSMSFMRGRTFLRKFVIIDEAQNLSPKQMKTLITRAGPGTKIVCMGNIAQIDTPYLTEGSSGLTYVVERFQGWPHAATITLTRGERSRLADYATEVL